MAVDTVRSRVDNSGRKQHSFPEPDVRMDLGTLLEKQAIRYRDKVCLTYIDSGEQYTYDEFNKAVNRLANGLRRLGVEKGDYVATMIRNRCEHLIVWFALCKLGAVEAIMNNTFVGEPLARLLNLTETKFLITEDVCLDAVVGVAGSLNYLEKVILIDGLERGKEALDRFEVLDYQGVLSDDCTNPPSVVVDDAEVMMLQPTSGTTGFSKACMISHRYAISYAAHVNLILEMTDQDVSYTFVPLFHGAGRFCDVLPTLMIGGRVTLRSKFSLSKFWPEVVECGATFFIGMGSVQALLWKAEPRPEETMHKVRITWCFPEPVAQDDFEGRFKVKLLPASGHYSETFCGMPIVHRYGDPGGIVRSCWEAKIMDEHDEELPDTEVGQLCLRPQEPGLMAAGYFGQPEATLAAWRNLWFHTGDLGKFDEEGYFHFLGRMGDGIRVKGENVSALEVESLYLNIPEVKECAAIGVPSDLGEEDVKVFIELSPEAGGEKAEWETRLMEWGQVNMNKFMAPRYLEVVDEFEVTETGKIKKKVLLKKHLEQQSAGAAR
jgi:carnitine-CoA ligase